MHNRLWIGRQLAHIPEIDPTKIYCPFCTEITNDILHLLINCPNALSLWDHVENAWNDLEGTYEDFIDEPLQITTEFKLFGIPTPKSQKSQNDNYKYILP